MNPTNDPNYDLIDTDIKRELFHPRLLTDEYWDDEAATWQLVNPDNVQHDFSSYHIYRRRKVQQVVSTIKESLTVQNDGWIDAKLIPPPKGEKIIAAFFHPNHKIKWSVSITTVDSENLTHWMPIPAMPKEPPKDPAEVAFEEWYESANDVPPGSKFICSRAFYAGMKAKGKSL